MLGAVGKSDRLDNTLVVYTADHGLNCGHHGLWGKGNATLPLNMLEESIRVPLLLSWAGEIAPSERRVEMVDHLDLFQTLAAVGGTEIPVERNFAGSSMQPLLFETERGRKWRDVQFGEYGTVRMVRTDRYKLVRRHPNGPDELFDLEADPRESRNRFDDPSCQAVISDLGAMLDSYFRRHSSPGKSGILGAELPQHNMTEAWRA